MYNIDKRGLMSSIAMGLLPVFKKEAPEEDRVTYHFFIILDMILGVMNSDIRNIDDAIDEQYRRYPEENDLIFLGDIIRHEIIDIKKQFMMAGFDRRLKYKLTTRDVGLHKLYGIQMDIDATVDALNSATSPIEVGNGSELVSQEPSLDELERAFNW